MFSRQGKLELYYLEYFNRLTSEDTMALRPSDINRTLLERPLAVALAHDPAISKKKTLMMLPSQWWEFTPLGITKSRMWKVSRG